MYLDFVKNIGKSCHKHCLKKIKNSVYGENIRRDVNVQFKCITENWSENYADSVKEWWPMNRGNLIVKLKDDASVDYQDFAKIFNQMPCHLGSFVLSHSKRLMNIAICEIKGFYRNNICYGDIDSACIHKRHWSTLVDNGYVGKSLRLGKNDYGDAGIFYAWFRAPKKNAVSPLMIMV